MLRVLVLYSGIGGMHCALLHARELRRLRLLGLFPSSLPSRTPHITSSRTKATAAASAASATAAAADAAVGHGAAAATSNSAVSAAEVAARPAANPRTDVVGEAEIAAAAAFPVVPAAAAQAATGGEGGALEAEVVVAEAHSGAAAEEVLPLTPQFLRELAGYALDGDSYCIHPLIAKHMKKLVMCAAGSRSYSAAAAAGYNAAPPLTATSDTAAAMSAACDSGVSCPAACAVAGGACVSATVPPACSACASASAGPACSASAAVVACPSASAASGRTPAASSPAAAAAAGDHFLSVAVVGAIDVNPTAMEVYRWNFVTSESASAAAFPSSTPASAVAAVPTRTSTSAGADAQHRLKRWQQQQARDQQEEQEAPLSSDQQLCYQRKAQGAHKHLVASPAAAALRADACTSAVARLDTPATQAARVSTAAAAAAGCLPAEETRTAEGGGGAGTGGCALPEEARGGGSAATKLQSSKTMSPAGSGVVMIEGRRPAAVADDNQGAAVVTGERESGSTAATYESSPRELKKDEAWKASPTKRGGGDGGAAEATQERTPAGLAAALEHGGKTAETEGKERGTGSRGLYCSSSSSRISKSRTDTTTIGSPYLSTRSISSFSAVEWCNFAADLWLVSPPCQPFTRSGFRRGNADARTSSLLQLLSTLCEMEKDLQPKYLLLENVVGFESSDTFASLLHALRCRCCYDVKVFHLNPLHFGIPNCRSRCFVTAVKRRNGAAVPAALQAGDEGVAEKERGVADALPAAGRPGSATSPAEAPEAAARESPAAAEEEEENKRARSATVQRKAASVEGTVAADTRTAASAVPDDEAAEQKAQEAAAATRETAFAGGTGDVAERSITIPAKEMAHAASLGAPAPATGTIQDDDETNFESSAGTHTEPEAARGGRRISSCCNTSLITDDLVRAPASPSACRQQKRSAVSHNSRAATAAVSGNSQRTTTAAKGAAAVTGTEEEKGSSSSSSTELFPLWDEDCVRCRRTLAAGVEVLPFIPGLYQQPLFFCCPIRPVDHFLEEDIPPKRNRSPFSTAGSFPAPSSAAAAPSARPSATGSTAAAPAAGVHAAAASSRTAPAATATSLPTAAASATATASVAAVCAASAHAGDPCPGAPTAAAVPPAAPHAADFSPSACTVAEGGDEAAGHVTSTPHGPAAAGADCGSVAASGSSVSVNVDAAGERQLFERRAQCAISAAKTSGEQGEREEAGTPEAESRSGSENVEREPSLSMEQKKSIWCQVDLVRKTDKRSCCFTRSYGRSGRAQYGSLLLLNDDLQLEERWAAFAEKQQRQQTLVSQQQQHQAEKQEWQREQGEEKEQQQRHTEGKQEQQGAEERQGCHQAQQEQRPTHERQRSEQFWFHQEDKTYGVHKEKQQQERAEHSRRPRKGWELHDVLAPGDVDVRFFSVREMLSLHGFPAVFAFPPRPANAASTKDFVAGPSAPPVSWTQQQRRLVGNSLNVYVVAMLIDYLIDDTDWH